LQERHKGRCVCSVHIVFFTLPLVQCTQDRSINASGWELATGTGNVFGQNDSGYPYVFALIIAPVILLILAFAGTSFGTLRNASIVGLLVKIIVLIVGSIQLHNEDLFELTPFVWLVVVIYIGLCIFSHCCINSEYTRSFSATVNRECRRCRKVYSRASSCPNCGSSLFEEKNQSASNSNASNLALFASNTGETWHCYKCSTVNALTATACKGCGYYK